MPVTLVVCLDFFLGCKGCSRFGGGIGGDILGDLAIGRSRLRNNTATTGGGAANPAWSAIRARLLGVPLVALMVPLVGTGLAHPLWALAFMVLGGALLGALGLGAGFLYHAWVLMRDDSGKQAMKTFGYSIIYLMALFAFLLVDHYVPYLLSYLS